jgi:uncharacterized membrane protein HdeD (DUF308 family)
MGCLFFMKQIVDNQKWLALVGLLLLGVGLFHGVHHHHDEPDCSTCILLPALVLSILTGLVVFRSLQNQSIFSPTNLPYQSVGSKIDGIRGPPTLLHF